MNGCKRWWQSREPRERRLMSVAMMAIFGFMLHFSWQEANRFRDDTQHALEQEKRALTTLPQLEQALAKRVVTAQKSAPTLEELTTQAKQQGLALTLAFQGQSIVLLAPAEIQFQSLLNWLTLVETRWQLRAGKLDVERVGQHVQLQALELRDDL